MSARPSPRPAVQPAPRHLENHDDALLALARKGTWLEPATAGNGTAARYRIRRDGAGGPVALLCTDVFEQLVLRRAIAVPAGGSRWQLTDTGRLAARRLLSRRGAPPAKADTVTPATSAVELPAPVPLLNPIESPLGWLRRRTDKDGRPLLGDAQFQAGERLRSDLYFAELSPRVTTNWAAVPGGGARGSAGGGVEQSDRAFAARERVNRALAAVGPELAGILVDVCGHLQGLEAIEDSRGWAKRSAKVVLELALTALARHYGYISPPAPEPRGGAHIKHWGSSDYRPNAQPWHGDGDGDAGTR